MAPKSGCRFGRKSSHPHRQVDEPAKDLKRILGAEAEFLRRTPWSRSRGQNSMNKELHKKRAKMTQQNPSPSSFMQQNESRTRSPRGKSPSGRMSRWPCKDYLRGTCTNSFCEKWHPPECLFYKSESGCRFGEKCSHEHRQVDEQPCKRSRKNGDKNAVAMLRKHELHGNRGSPLFPVTYVKSTTDLMCAIHQVHDNWVAFCRTWSRRSCRQFYGRAQTCRKQSNV